MHFSSGILRSPFEANSGFLQITSGCSHNSCRFCTFFKDAPFRISPREEIEEDLKELRESSWKFTRLYLQGADPFIRKYDDLMWLAEKVKEYLPHVTSIGGYARVDNLRKR